LHAAGAGGGERERKGEVPKKVSCSQHGRCAPCKQPNLVPLDGTIAPAIQHLDASTNERLDPVPSYDSTTTTTTNTKTTTSTTTTATTTTAHPHILTHSHTHCVSCTHVVLVTITRLYHAPHSPSTQHHHAPHSPLTQHHHASGRIRLNPAPPNPNWNNLTWSR
jgi:hypothetical protein